MNKGASKWLVRAASLLVVLGFFLPSVAVSCTVLPGAKESFSMSDLASQNVIANGSFLYLVLLGALAVLIFALIPPRNQKQNLMFLIGQAAGFGLGILSILIVILSLSNNLEMFNFEVGPDAGSFVLILGYVLGGVGIFMGFLHRENSVPQAWSGAPPEPLIAPPPLIRQPPNVVGPRLELASGNAPSIIPIQGSDFTIGRSSRSQLRLNDSQISGQHARFRFAQGAWFIQDQNSSNGTFVNERRVQAQRLNDGDRIRIGGTVYIFHS